MFFVTIIKSSILCEETYEAFKSLLVAPATLGLLAPITASATEVNFKAISNYSYENSEIDVNTFKTSTQENILLSGGEGLVETAHMMAGFQKQQLHHSVLTL